MKPERWAAVGLLYGGALAENQSSHYQDVCVGPLTSGTHMVFCLPRPRGTFLQFSGGACPLDDAGKNLFRKSLIGIGHSHRPPISPSNRAHFSSSSSCAAGMSLSSCKFAMCGGDYEGTCVRRRDHNTSNGMSPAELAMPVSQDDLACRWPDDGLKTMNVGM